LYPTWARSPKYVELLADATSAEDATSDTSAQGAQLLQQLIALPTNERAEAIAAVMVKLLAKVMETKPEQIDPSVPLPSLGLDSLMAMDLKTAIDNSFAVKVPMLALMKGNSIEQLAQQVAVSITAENVTSAAAADEAPSARNKYHELPKELDLEIAERMIAKLDEFADEEVDRMLELLTREEEMRP